jgi:hypothetical protein
VSSPLRGKKAIFDLSSCGGSTTAAAEVTSAEDDASKFWPTLSKKLAALQASLR